MRFFSVVFSIVALALWSCDSKMDEQLVIESWEIQGDSASKTQVYYFFEEIGGLENWAELNFAHAKSNVSEPTFSSYLSEKWFSLQDTTQLLFKQTVKDYSTVQLLNGSKGWVSELGNASEMSDNTRGFMEHWHSLDFFICIAKLAKGNNLFIKFTEDGFLYVLDQNRGKVLFGYKFESGSWLPKQFLRPMFNSQNISLLINQWREMGDLKVPSNLSTLDGEFMEELDFVEFCKDPECLNVEFTVEYMNSL